MSDIDYRDLNREPIFDAGRALRCLRGKDQVTIRLDDPDFFSVTDNDTDNASTLSATHRILMKK